ncbi:YaiI/YqxD family protein, partial [Escherichia coli]
MPHSCREIHCFDNRWQKHKQNYAGR